MSTLIITPLLASEAASKDKPAIVTVSSMNVTFNAVAVHRLALKTAVNSVVKFQLLIKDGKLYYKETSADDAFQIKSIDEKSRAQLISRGVYIILQEQIKKTGKVMRFEIQDFKDGMRELKLVEA